MLGSSPEALLVFEKCAETAQKGNPLIIRRIPVWKRAMDIVGSLAGLIVFSPLFLIISLMIKIVSPGAVFFRQERVGLGGEKFSVLKFRTMKMNTDTSAHEQYLSGLINSNVEDEVFEKPMTKLDDGNSQIIIGGKILRKSYLDELPQLINVIRGDMSLIGPRPPIPYEVAEYRQWHNGRLDMPARNDRPLADKREKPFVLYRNGTAGYTLCSKFVLSCRFENIADNTSGYHSRAYVRPEKRKTELERSKG